MDNHNKTDLQKKVAELEQENAALKADNQKLENQFEQAKQAEEASKTFKQKVLSKAATWYISEDLQQSTEQLYAELPTPSHKTTGKFLGSFINRWMRIGLLPIIFTNLLALLTLIVLVVQSFILLNQNRKIDVQNDRIEAQVYLEEANRRSNLVLLMDNILQQVNQEITTTNDTLSTPLIGRIVSLSQSFQPYYFLADSTNLTTKKYSPERGQLLLALALSGIGEPTLDKIYAKANFSSAYLKGADMTGLYFKGVNLRGANLMSANLRYANLRYANLRYANLRYANLMDANLMDAILWDAILWNANLMLANLMLADLKYANLRDANLRDANLWYANLWYANLRDANLRDANLSDANLSDANLINARVSDSLWLNKLKEQKVKGFKEIQEKYEVKLGKDAFGHDEYRIRPKNESQ